MELYSKLYLYDFARHQGNLFARVERDYPKCNLDHFVEHFFNSEFHRMIAEGHPHYLNFQGVEMLDELLREGYQFVDGPCYLARSDMRWVGEFYARYQHAVGLPGPEVLKELPVDRVAFIYPTFHTLSFKRAVEEAIEIYHEHKDIE